MPEWCYVLEFSNGETSPGWFVFNPRGMRNVVELAGCTVEEQTGILAEHVVPAAVR